MMLQVSYTKNGTIHKTDRLFLQRPVAGHYVEVQHEAELILLRVVTVVHRVIVRPDLVICSVADEIAEGMLKALEVTNA
jgi:hypothetical protein